MTDKEKKADTWMPLWIGAYLADTMKLTTLQHGAYLLLLIAYWRERKALADNDDELRSITKLERPEWKRNRPVLAKFFRVGDGVWWHKRVEEEIQAAEARAKKASEKAGKAAQARWADKPKDVRSDAPSIPQAMHETLLDECPPPSPTPPSESEGVTSATTDAPLSDPDTHGLPDGWMLPKAWGDWTLANCPTWDADRVRLEATRFADHHRSKASRKADWAATWRLWCSDAITQRVAGAISPPAPQAPTATADFERAQRQLASQRMTDEERAASAAARKAVFGTKKEPA